MANVKVRGGSLYLHYSVDGKLYRKALGLKNSRNNMRLAINKASEIEELILNNVEPTDEDLRIERTVKKDVKELFLKMGMDKLDFAFNMYLADMPKSKNKAMYKCAINKFEEIFNTSEMKIEQVSEIAGNTYKDYLLKNLSYNTARTYQNYMHIIFNSFIKRKIYTQENPFIRLKRKDVPFIVTIPDSHFDMILEYLKKNNLALYRFIFFLRYTGFRFSEALALEWNQIKWKESIISLKNFKDSREDIFPLDINNGILKRFLLSFRQENGKIFNLNAHYILKPFQKSIVALNKQKKETDKKWKDIPKYNLHQIRKSAISNWAQIIMPSELKVLARHRDIGTTMRYYVSIGVSDIAKKINRYKG